MASLQVYLAFNGNCREAMTFYNEAFNGELKFMTFAESPMKNEVPEEFQNMIMHCNILKDGFVLMAADNFGNNQVTFGSSVSLVVNCATEEEETFLFNQIGRDGTITMPLQDTFWGARYGMLIDKFGISWMFNFEKQAH